jgi:hypothetical protein
MFAQCLSRASHRGQSSNHLGRTTILLSHHPASGSTFSQTTRIFYRVPDPEQGWAKATAEKVTSFPESGLEDPQISRDGHELFYSRARTTGDIWLIKTGQSHQ